MDADRLGKLGLGALSVALVVAGLTAMAAWGPGWAVAWLLVLVGLVASAASFFLRRRDRQRLRRQLDEMAMEWER